MRQIPKMTSHFLPVMLSSREVMFFLQLLKT